MPEPARRAPARGGPRRVHAAARTLRALALMLALAAPGAARAAELGFVHVEGNVGGASGGHVALALDGRAWHLRVGPGGLLRLERASWEDFVFHYAVLGNRPLHVARVRVAEEDARTVERALTARWLRELERDAAVAARLADRALLEALAGAAAGVPVPGAGLLDPDRRGAPGAAVLRRRADAALGPGGLAAARARSRAAAARPPGPEPADLERRREALALGAALDPPGPAAPPRAAAAVVARAAAGARLPLDAAGRRALRARAAALEDAVAGLLASTRPDRGRALLVSIARHRAVHRSLATGTLHLVDALPDGPPALEAEAARRRREELDAVAAALAAELGRAWRAARADGRLDEAEARHLEATASRAVEAARGGRDGRPVRVAPAHPVPSRSRRVRPPGSSRPSPTQLARARARNDAALRVARAVRAEGRRYQLVLHNCATELVRAVEQALGGPDAAARALGGRLAPGEDGSFVPFLLQHHVRERFRVVGETRVPSWRERRLAAAYAAEPDALVWLRERTVLTSRIYAPRDRDGSFLLFTDGAPWARPVFGLVNLGAGVLDGALGLATAPFDGGRRLLRAGRGVLFSLPELVFANVRKGSFDAASLPSDAAGEAPGAPAP